MNIGGIIKAQHLPKEEFVVFGSGPLAIHGIRETRDIDLFISPKLYEALKSRGWEEKFWPSGDRYLVHDIFEVTDSWDYDEYNPSFEEIRSRAEIYDDIPYASLEDVLVWKKAFGREKDQKDIKAIEDYLFHSHS